MGAFLNRTGTVIVSVALVVLVYLGHAYLQQQYYTHCSSNLLKVVLLQRSDMCIQLHTFLKALESVCSNNVINIITAVTAYVASSKAAILV
jgi:predicted nucleic acid-binding Zn finger protein